MEKMSKSKGNGVDPQEMINRYGADTVRLFSMFASPPDQSLEWSDAGVEGSSRFLKRLWKLSLQVAGYDLSAELPASPDDAQKNLRRKTHETTRKVTDDMDRRHTFNTAIAAVMELLNELARFEVSSAADQAVAREALQSAVLMLSPVVPHISHRLWQLLGHSESACDVSWPALDEAALHRDELEMVLQVNGKLRGRMTVSADADKDSCEQLALDDENVRRHTEGKTVRKVIVVPGKLVNIVAT